MKAARLAGNAIMPPAGRLGKSVGGGRGEVVRSMIFHDYIGLPEMRNVNV